MTSVFLENGARICLRLVKLGLDQLAYATPKCDSIVELVAAEGTGYESLARLASRAEQTRPAKARPEARSEGLTNPNTLALSFIILSSPDPGGA